MAPIPKRVKTMEEEQISTAWRVFAYNVSIGGLIELYQAKQKSIRWLWIIALLAAMASIFYHAYLLVVNYFAQRLAFQIIPTSKLVIPFPNVTACVPAGINKTFALENLKIPARVQKVLRNLTKEKRRQFMEQAVLLVSFSMENMVDFSFTPSSPFYREYGQVTAKTHDEFVGGMSQFFRDSVASCEDSITNCFYAGIQYDCCKNSVFKLGEGGPCFEMPVRLFSF